MTLRDFVEMTIEAASGSGWSEYLPTVALPTVREIRVLEGIPDGVDHREALVEYVVRNAWGDRELFFGVRSGPDEIAANRPSASNLAWSTVPLTPAVATTALSLNATEAEPVSSRTLARMSLTVPLALSLLVQG